MKVNKFLKTINRVIFVRGSRSRSFLQAWIDNFHDHTIIIDIESNFDIDMLSNVDVFLIPNKNGDMDTFRDNLIGMGIGHAILDIDNMNIVDYIQKFGVKFFDVLDMYEIHKGFNSKLKAM